MAPERLTLRLPEIPTGEKFANIVISSTRDAIIQTYPFIQDHYSTCFLPDPDKTIFMDENDLANREKSDKPTEDNLYYQYVSAAGVNNDYMQGRFYQVDKSQIYRENSPGSPLFVSNEVLNDLTDNDPNLRLGTALVLSKNLIHEFLEKAPMSRQLDYSPWGEIVRNRSNQFFEQENDNFVNANRRQLLKAKRILSSLIDPKTKFIAQGVTIHMLFPNQTLTNSEFKIGGSFANGMSSLIAKGINQNFNRIMERKGIITGYPSPDVETVFEKQAFAVCKSISGLDVRDRNEFMNMYLDSLIPLYIINNRRSDTIDPWFYPS